MFAAVWCTVSVVRIVLTIAMPSAAASAAKAARCARTCQIASRPSRITTGIAAIRAEMPMPPMGA